MKSRYDFMRPSNVEDIDGKQFPDPLTINYQSIIDGAPMLPDAIQIRRPDLKRLWVRYYKETDRTDMDDVIYSANGIEHVGVLEPEDTIYLFNLSRLKQFGFKDLT